MTPTLIVAILEALPAMMQAAPRALSLIERFLTWSNSKDLNRWIDELEGGIDALEKAQTEQEKLAAARTLVDTIRKL